MLKDRKKFLAVFDSLPEALLVLQPDAPNFTVAAVNDAHLEFTGLRRSEVIGNGVFDLFPGGYDEELSEGAGWLKNSIKKVIETGKKDSTDTIRYDLEDPETGDFREKYWDITNAPVFDQFGRLMYIVNRAKDVTERVLSNRKNKEMINLVNQNRQIIKQTEVLSSLGNWELELRNNELFCSDGVYSILGYEPDEMDLTIDKVLDMIHPEDRDRAVDQLGKTISEGNDYFIKLRLIRKDGRVRHVILSGSLVRDSSKRVVKLIGVFQDVTDQKNLEDEKDTAIAQLKQRVNEQECLQRISSLDAQSGSIPKMLKDAAQIIPGGLRYPGLANVSLEYAGSKFGSKLPETDRVSFKTSSKRKKRAEVTLRIALGDAKGQSDAGLTFEEEVLMQSVTEQISLKIDHLLRRRELLESRSRTKKIMNQSPDIICTIDGEGRFVKLNDAVKHILYYSPKELEGKLFMDFVLPEDHRKTKKASDLIISGREVYNFENRYIRLDGEPVPLVWSARWDPDDELIYAIARDATEKQEAEKEIRERKEFIETTLENLPIGIALNTIEDGKTHLLNNKFTEIYGWPEQDLQNVEDFFKKAYPDPEYRQKIKTMISEGIQSRDPDKMRWDNIEITTKKGEKRTISARIIPLFDQGIMISTVIDITKQKQYERELKESLNEKEVLLAEIHHRVKNNLAIVSSLMQLQAFKAEDEGLEKKLYDSMFRVNTMATIHELLYQSGSFSKLNFSDIIEKLINALEQVWGNEKEIQHKIRKEPIELNINQAIPCSLLINEVVTNIYKHAFSGRDSGTLSIELKCDSNNEVKVKISDDGVGLPESFDKETSNSLGLHLIKVLTTQLMGNSEFISNEKGTVFNLSFKKLEVSGIGSSQIK